MRYKKSILLLWVFFTSTVGCSNVTSTQRLGDAVGPEKAKDFEGVWLATDNSPFHVRHVKNNELRIGSLNWKDGRYVAGEITGFVTSDDGQEYINLLDSEHQASGNEYVFVQVVKNNTNHILLYWPQVSAFEKAVNNGRLAGDVVRKENSGVEVVLKSDTRQLNAYIHPDEKANQFGVEPSVLLRCIKKFPGSAQ
jgi:hypothetical protein